MSRNSELVKNTFWISVAQISAQAVNFLFIPLYISVLSTEEYGVLDLYVTIRNVLASILFLGIEHGIFRFCVSERNIRKKQTFFSTGIIMVFMLLAVYSFLFWMGIIMWDIQYALLLYMYYTSYLLYLLLLQIVRSFEKANVYAAATALGTALTVFFSFITVVCLKYHVEGVLASSAAAYTMVNIYMLAKIPLRTMFIPKWDKGAAKEIMRYSLPLTLNGVMGGIASSSDRIIIRALLGNAMNGIYALANKFYSILIILTQGFNVAWAETVIKVMGQPDHRQYYRKIICLLMDCLFAIISGIIILLPFLFDRFINDDYKAAYDHIPIIIYAAFWYIMATAIGQIFLAYKKSGELGVGSLLVAVINLTVHLLLIGRIGLFAASISTLASYVGLFAFRYLFLHRCENITFPWGRMLIQLCIYTILCGCYYMKIKIFLLIGLFIYLVSIVALSKIYGQELVQMWTKIRLKMRKGEMIKWKKS